MYFFENVRYIRSHGKAPRGRGQWAFEMKGRSEVMFSSFNLTLSEAKKEITLRLKSEGVPSGTIVYVAP